MARSNSNLQVRICYLPYAPFEKWATWIYDSDEKYYFSGHYFESLEEAYCDYQLRGIFERDALSLEEVLKIVERLKSEPKVYGPKEAQVLAAQGNFTRIGSMLHA